jgi:hypothetical protein
VGEGQGPASPQCPGTILERYIMFLFYSFIFGTFLSSLSLWSAWWNNAHANDKA